MQYIPVYIKNRKNVAKLSVVKKILDLYFIHFFLTETWLLIAVIVLYVDSILESQFLDLVAVVS